MKSYLYYKAAFILIKLHYLCVTTSIRLDRYQKVCRVRGIYHSNTSHKLKIEMMNKMLDNTII